MLRSLVGSEMCIRDRLSNGAPRGLVLPTFSRWTSRLGVTYVQPVDLDAWCSACGPRGLVLPTFSRWTSRLGVTYVQSVDLDTWCYQHWTSRLAVTNVQPVDLDACCYLRSAGGLVLSTFCLITVIDCALHAAVTCGPIRHSGEARCISTRVC